MNMRIIADSCCDIDTKIQDKTGLSIVPLSIGIGDKTYIDDENLDMDDFMADMKKSQEVPKTACPSPQAFIEEFEKDGSVFAVTLSSALSGTYKSAMMAKDIFMEEIGDKFIHVFDSMSASVGETLVSLKIWDLIEKGLKERDIVEKVNSYIKEMKTFFTLKTLDTLVKAGRVNPIVAKVSAVLHVRPIMKGTEKGEIKVHEKVIGERRAFRRFIEIIGEEGGDLREKTLGIAHCNALEKALQLKEEVKRRYNFKDIIIVKTAGISTVYANEGGLIIAF